MLWLRKHKSLVIFIILLILALPYIVHINQDIDYTCISHDEAERAKNARDIILFGPQSLIFNPLQVQFPLNILIALVSFSLFGISLATLRLPYAILNILGNILFFDLVRRKAGSKIAVVTTILFALGAPRIAIGKTGMAESIVLPLVITLCWILVFMHKRPKIYFLLGLISGLASLAKIDNFIVLLPLLIFSFIDDINNQKVLRFIRTKWLLGGFGIVVLAWIIYAFMIGWNMVLGTFTREIFINLSEGGLYLSDGVSFGRLFSWELIHNNILKLWNWYPLFTIMVCVSGLIMVLIVTKKYSSMQDPFIRAIILLLVLFISKIIVTTNLNGRRIAPCFPLPFLILVYIWMSWQRLRGLNKRAIILAGICILFFILPLIKKTLYNTYNIIFYPKYTIIDRVERVNRIIDSCSRIGYYGAEFTYFALYLPNMFYDLERYEIPNTIKRERIAYLMIYPNNKILEKFAEAIPGAELVMNDGYLILYRIQWDNIKEQDYQEAEEIFSKVEAADLHERYNNSGRLYYKEHRYKDAENMFRKALEMNPERYPEIKRELESAEQARKER